MKESASFDELVGKILSESYKFEKQA